MQVKEPPNSRLKSRECGGYIFKEQTALASWYAEPAASKTNPDVISFEGGKYNGPESSITLLATLSNKA